MTPPTTTQTTRSAVNDCSLLGDDFRPILADITYIGALRFAPPPEVFGRLTPPCHTWMLVMAVDAGS
jgi:hypothetical protein